MSLSRPVAALLFCALFASGAQAQFGGGMGGGGGGGMHRGGDRSGRAPDSQTAQPARPSLADQLDQAGAQLLLTKEQGAAWSAFRTAFMALQRPAGSAAMSDSQSASAAMQRKLSQAQDQFTLVESLAEALKSLERQLDAQQRAAEDRVMPPVLAEFVRVGAERR